MDQVRRRHITGWLVLGAVLVALNLACLGGSLRLRAIRIPDGTPYNWSRRGPVSATYMLYDGSVYDLDPFMTPPRFIMIYPPTPWGLVRVWWPVAAGLAISLALKAVGPDRILRLSRAIRSLRLTLLQSMILIGAACIWLFLFRINVVILTVGSLVIVLMVHSAFRRNSLAREIRTQGGSAPALSMAGAFAYAIAVVLALIWVVTIVVWDSYRQGR